MSRESFLNSACEAFRKYSADLRTAIQDTDVLAWDLYAESIITDTVRDTAVNIMHERVARTSTIDNIPSRIRSMPSIQRCCQAQMLHQKDIQYLCESYFFHLGVPV